jgi:hypothetical protein
MNIINIAFIVNTAAANSDNYPLSFTCTALSVILPYCYLIIIIIIIIIISGNYKPGGIYRQEGRPTNTDCENTPTQHQISNVADS